MAPQGGAGTHIKGLPRGNQTTSQRVGKDGSPQRDFSRAMQRETGFDSWLLHQIGRVWRRRWLLIAPVLIKNFLGDLNEAAGAAADGHWLTRSM